MPKTQVLVSDAYITFHLLNCPQSRIFKKNKSSYYNSTHLMLKQPTHTQNTLNRTARKNLDINKAIPVRVQIREQIKK